MFAVTARFTAYLHTGMSVHRRRPDANARLPSRAAHAEPPRTRGRVPAPGWYRGLLRIRRACRSTSAAGRRGSASADRSMSSVVVRQPRDRDAHRGATGPRRPAEPARAVALDGVDHGAGPPVAGRPVGVVADPLEPDEGLVEDHVVEDRDARSGRQPFGHPASVARSRARSRSTRPRPAERSQRGQDGEAARPPRRFGHPVVVVAFAATASRRSTRHRGSSPRDGPPASRTKTSPESYGTLSHLWASVDHESAAEWPRIRCRSDGTAAAQIPNAPSTWTQAPCS